jgi:hypothetical protein
MNAERDVEQILERWLVDGVDEMPDRVYRTVLDRVDHQSQRPAWRLRPWRLPAMSTPIKLVAVGAALLTVLLGGAVFLGGGGAPTPTPTPTPTPSPAATPSPTATLPSEPSPVAHTGLVQGDTLAFTYAAPATWTNGGWAFTNARGYAGPAGIGVGVSGAVNVPIDPCDGIGKVSDAATAEDVVADLRARDDLVVSDARPATLGGLDGLRVDVQVPTDLGACADLYMIFAEPDGSGVYAQGPANMLDLWILEAEGGPIWVDIEHFAGTPADDYAEAQALVDSIVFTP